MSKLICTFNQDCLTEFKTWLEEGSFPKIVYCKLCCLLFNVSNMGRSAVTSHAEGKNQRGKESLFQHRFAPQVILDSQILWVALTLSQVMANHPHLCHFRPQIFN